MNKREQMFNWQETHARLERTGRALQTGGELPQEEAARILRHRASALATPQEGAAPATETLPLLVFTLSGERFGIETARVLEVVSLRELIPVPYTPTFIIGVTHHRGRVLTILDLQQLLNLPGNVKDKAENRNLIPVEVGGMTFGMVVDSVVGILSVPAHKVAPPSAVLSGLALAITRGITEELITILDLDVLARTPEILVKDEVN